MNILATNNQITNRRVNPWKWCFGVFSWRVFSKPIIASRKTISPFLVWSFEGKIFCSPELISKLNGSFRKRFSLSTLMTSHRQKDGRDRQQQQQRDQQQQKLHTDQRGSGMVFPERTLFGGYCRLLLTNDDDDDTVSPTTFTLFLSNLNGCNLPKSSDCYFLLFLNVKQCNEWRMKKLLQELSKNLSLFFPIASLVSLLAHAHPLLLLPLQERDRPTDGERGWSEWEWEGGPDGDMYKRVSQCGKL